MSLLVFFHYNDVAPVVSVTPFEFDAIIAIPDTPSAIVALPVPLVAMSLLAAPEIDVQLGDDEVSVEMRIKQ